MATGAKDFSPVRGDSAVAEENRRNGKTGKWQGLPLRHAAHATSTRLAGLAKLAVQEHLRTGSVGEIRKCGDGADTGLPRPNGKNFKKHKIKELKS